MEKDKKCEHIVAFHIGHGTLTLKQYEEEKRVDDLSCCGGTMVLSYCPLCGEKLK